jgi:WD40 repeat protein/tetratricopeptide (TPR) repeat protein/Leucine-rich repeat (LRR) protein
VSSKYDAFISYSHRGDGVLAANLQRALERFAKPLFKRRSMRVFRDTTNLDANPDFWGTIEKALEASAHLILFASPESAHPDGWVEREVKHFVAAHGDLKRVIIVLSAGKVPWLEEADPEAVLADPECAVSPDVYKLLSGFGNPPFIVDLRAHRSGGRWRPAFSRDFVDKVASIAARVLGREKDEIFSEHITRQRRQVVLGASLVGAAAIAFGAAYYQWQQRLDAAEAARRTTAREFQGYAEAARERRRFDDALVHIAKAHSVDPESVPLARLVEASIGGSREIWSTSAPFTGFSGNFVLARGSRSAVGTLAQGLGRWDLATGELLERFELQAPGGVAGFALSPNERWIAVGTYRGEVHRWERETARRETCGGKARGVRALVVLDDGTTIFTAISSDGKHLLRSWPPGANEAGWESQLERGETWVLGAAEGKVWAASADGSIQGWDLESGEVVLRRARGEPGTDKRLVVLSADCDLVLRTGGRHTDAGNEALVVSKVQSGDRLLELDAGGHPSCAAFSPDGQRVIAGFPDGSVRAWSLEAGKPLFSAEPAVPGARIETVAFLSDRYAAYSATAGRELIWDTVQGESDAPHSLRLLDVTTGKDVRRFHSYDCEIRAVDYSPDGALVASCGADKLVRLWDARDGKEGRAFSGHSDMVTGIDFTPDGRRLVSSSWDGTVRVWNLEAGGEIRKLEGFEGAVGCVAVHPGGERVAAGGGFSGGPLVQSSKRKRDYALRIWSLPDGEAAGGPLQGHAGSVTAVAFSSDGRLLLSASEDNTVRIWREDGTAVRTIGGPAVFSGQVNPDLAEAVLAAVFLPDGQSLLAAFGNGHVQRLDAAVGALMDSFPGHKLPVTALDVSSDGRRMVTGASTPSAQTPRLTSDEILRVWDLELARETERIGLFPEGIAALALTADGREVAVAGRDHRLRVFRLGNEAELRSMAWHSRWGTPLAIAVDELKVISQEPEFSQRRLLLVDLSTGAEEPIATSEMFGPASVAGFSPDGTRFYLVREDWARRTIEIGDTADPQPARRRTLSQIEVEDRTIGFVDRDILVLADWNEVVVVDAASGMRKDRLPLSEGLRPLSLNPAKLEALMIAADGSLKFWEFAARKVTRDETSPGGVPGGARFSPSGQHLALVDAEGQFFVGEIGADAMTWKRLPVSSPAALAFTADGQTLVTGNNDGSAVVWDVSSGAVMARVQLGEPGPADFAVSSTGDRLLTFSSDPAVRVWDLALLRESFEALSRLTPEERFVWAQAVTASRLENQEVKRDQHSAPPAVVWLTADGQPPEDLPGGESTPGVANRLDLPAKVNELLAAGPRRRASLIAARRQDWLARPVRRRDNQPGVTAIEALRRQLRTDRFSPPPRSRLRESAEKLLEVAPLDVEATVCLAEARIDQGDVYGGLETAREAVSIVEGPNFQPPSDHPARTDAYRTYAKILGQTNRFWEGYRAYREVFSGSPSDWAIDLCLYAELQVRLGFYEEARDTLARAETAQGAKEVAGQIQQGRDLTKLFVAARKRAPRLPAAIVTNVVPRTALAELGVRAGDIIVRLNDEEHDTPMDFNAAWQDLGSRSIADPTLETRLVLSREGEQRTLRVMGSLAGLNLNPVQAPCRGGVFVMRVFDTAAHEAGLMQFDEICAINDREVRTRDDVDRARDAVEDGAARISCRVRRYERTPRGGFRLQRDVAGALVLNDAGQPEWAFTEFVIEIPNTSFRLDLAEPGLMVPRLGGFEGKAEVPEPPRKKEPRPKKPPLAISKGQVTADRSATDADLAAVAGRKDMERVNLGRAAFTDEAFVHLAGLENLTELTVRSPLIRGEGLRHLSRLQRLRRLFLAGTSVEDGYLEHLLPLAASLTDLDLSSTRITNDALLHISKLHGLQILSFEKTGVSGSALGALSALEKLYALDLDGTPLSAASLKALSGCQRLTRLSVSGCRLTDEHVEALLALMQVKRLDLSGTGLSDAAAAALASRRDLVVLSLARTSVGDRAVEHLERLSELSDLDLSLTQVTDASLQRLARLQKLERLHLRGTNLRGDGLCELSRLPQLETLDLDDTQVGDDDLECLRRLNKLRDLSLAGSQVSQAGIEDLEKALPETTVTGS